MEKKTRADSAAVTEKAKCALLAILREACRDEHIPHEIETRATEAMLEAVRTAFQAYACCRAHAWDGLAIAYDEAIRIDGGGISGATLKHS